jgi:hypothetical protein
MVFLQPPRISPEQDVTATQDQALQGWMKGCEGGPSEMQRAGTPTFFLGQDLGPCPVSLTLQEVQIQGCGSGKTHEGVRYSGVVFLRQQGQEVVPYPVSGEPGQVVGWVLPEFLTQLPAVGYGICLGAG